MNRYFSFAVILYLAVTAAAFGQGSYLLQMPNSASASGAFTVYVDSANPLNPVASPTGPAGLGYVIAKPGGQGFYLIGSTSIESIDPAFATAPRVITGLAGPPTAAAITPNGNSLLVGVTDGNGNGFLYVVSTATDTIVGSAIPIPGPPAFQPESGITALCPECFIAVSRDSTTAWVLTNTGLGSRLSAVNLTTGQLTNQLVLSAGATSVTLAPLGLLYVTAVNAIYEINPATLTITPSGTIQLFFTPYQLHFTPDGTTAYVVNLFPTSGGSILQFTVATHQTLTWPPFQAGVSPPTFTDVFVAGNTRIFAFDSALSTLADVSPTNFTSLTGVAPSALSAGPNNTQLPVIAFAISNELPTAEYAFMLVGNGSQTNLYRMLLSTNTVDVENQVAVNAPGMQVVTIPPQTGAASFLTYNFTSGGVTVNDSNQVLLTGGAATPLLVRVLNANGLPVYNAQVSFTETDSIGGAVITNASTVTNADGYVTANVTIPNSSGIYTIAATVDGATQVFTLTVPGAGVTGPGGSTSTQVSIVTGDGQLVFQNSVSIYPLTILVTDTSGNPLPNVPVTFSSSNGACSFGGDSPLTNPTTITDANGHASTYFFGGELVINTTLVLCPVVAATQLGAVTFNETIALISLLGVAGNGVPQFNPITPSSLGGLIVAPEGQPVANAIEVQILATLFPQTGLPIPEVGVYTFNPQDVANGIYPGCLSTTPPSCTPPPATCVGSSNSDSSGITHCNLVSVCQLGFYSLGVAFGNPYLSTTYELQITPGGPAMFNIIGGNNQSGVAGQTLSQSLTATLSDACGNTVPAGTAVTWKVTQGSATLVGASGSTNAQGVVSTRVTLGQTPGPVTVTATTATGVTATFTLTNSVVVSSITLVSGGGQTAQEGVQFAQPLVFLVTDNHGNPVSGITVSFTVSGFATVNPGSTTTNSSGLAQTTATAAGSPGSAVITAATAAGFSASATIATLQPGPGVTNTSFTNAASGAVGLAECGLGTLKGAGIATGVQGVVSGLGFGPLPLQLAGFSMTFQSPGGPPIQAPIESVSNVSGAQQVNFQTPCELTPGLATVVVSANGASTTVPNVLILAAQPGIFTDGGVFGVVISAATGAPVSTTNFAVRGQTYYVYVTGLGQTNPPLSTDSVGVANQNVLAQIVVGVANQGVIVTSAQTLQDETGVYLIGFQIPQNFPTGPNQNLVVEAIVGGAQVYSNTVLLGGVQ